MYRRFLAAAFLSICSGLSAFAVSGEGDFSFLSMRDFSRSNAGLGVSMRFVGVFGWVDQFVYNLGKTWRDGIQDPDFARHFDSFIDSIVRLRKNGDYSQSVFLFDRIENIGGVKFRHAAFRISTKKNGNAENFESHIYLSAIGGNLVKFRASLYEPVDVRAQNALSVFLESRVAEIMQKSRRAAEQAPKK